MNYDQNKFVQNWWKQAQRLNTNILTKPRRKAHELAKKDEVIRSLKQDISNLENSIDAQILNQEREKNQNLQTLLDQTIELLGQEDIKNLTDLKNILKGQTLKELLNLYQQKINDQDQALINLAKTKLTNKKEAKALVEQLEQNWNNDRVNWAQEKAQLNEQNQAQENELNQTITNLTEQGEQKQTKIAELQEWNQGQHNRIQELETSEQTLIREKADLTEEKQRQIQQANRDKETYQREKQELTNQKTHQLAEQKTFYENQIQGQENQIRTNEQTITNLEAQITSQQEQNTLLKETTQNREQTIRDNQQRINQLETYLQTSQQDNQTKQNTINTLNQEKTTLQTKITQLTQKDTENTRKLAEQSTTINTQQQNITELNQTKTTLQTQLNEANTKIERQKGVLEQLLRNREEELREIEKVAIPGGGSDNV